MDDVIFAKKCAGGDPAARNEFLAKYSRLIYKYILSVSRAYGRPQAADHADDIFQDFFCFLFADNGRKLLSFQGRNGCTLASWLRLVAARFTLDYLGKLKPLLSIEEDVPGAGSLKGILADAAQGASAVLMRDEQMDNLKECIETLETDDKYFIEMHIHRGVGLDALKEHLRTTRPALEMYKSRLIGRLRECFRKKGYVIA